MNNAKLQKLNTLFQLAPLLILLLLGLVWVVPELGHTWHYHQLEADGQLTTRLVIQTVQLVQGHRYKLTLELTNTGREHLTNGKNIKLGLFCRPFTPIWLEAPFRRVDHDLPFQFEDEHGQTTGDGGNRYPLPSDGLAPAETKQIIVYFRRTRPSHLRPHIQCIKENDTWFGQEISRTLPW